MHAGFLRRAGAEGVRLLLMVVGERLLIDALDLVVGEVRLFEVRPLLQDDDAKAGGGKFFGDDAARRARADDNEVDFVRRLIF